MHAAGHGRGVRRYGDAAGHLRLILWKATERRTSTGLVWATVKMVKDGSISVTPVLSPLAGAHTIVASAVNAKTGEARSITGSLSQTHAADRYSRNDETTSQPNRSGRSVSTSEFTVAGCNTGIRWPME